MTFFDLKSTFYNQALGSIHLCFMVKQIFYSILIPVYNAEKYLEDCLNSILKQNYKNYEIILVNDGSTDDSMNICNKYTKNNSNTHVYHRCNHGVFQSRVFAYSKSSGEYCIYIDADDFWEPDALETINNYITKTKVDLLIFNYNKVSQNGWFSGRRESIFAHESVFDRNNNRQLYEKLVFSSALNNLWNKVFKRKNILLDSFSKLPTLNTGEDFLMSVEILKYTQKIIYIDLPLYNYREVNTSITHSISEKTFADVISIKNARQMLMNSKGLTSIQDKILFCNNILNEVLICTTLYVRSCSKILEAVSFISGIYQYEFDEEFFYYCKQEKNEILSLNQVKQINKERKELRASFDWRKMSDKIRKRLFLAGRIYLLVLFEKLLTLFKSKKK